LAYFPVTVKQKKNKNYVLNLPNLPYINWNKKRRNYKVYVLLLYVQVEVSEWHNCGVFCNTVNHFFSFLFITFVRILKTARYTELCTAERIG
jgi:hypothetical protein